MNFTKNVFFLSLLFILLMVFLVYFFDVKQKKLLSIIEPVYRSKTNLFDDPNDVVFKYITLPMDYAYGSNSIPLTVASLITDGDILELGMGSYSTPLLHNIVAHNNRQLHSIETNYNWMKRFLFYNLTKSHKIYHVSEADIYKYGLNKEWGVVLVDHGKADKRHINVADFSKLAKIVVLHDAEKMAEGGYKYEANKVRSHFAYACKFSVYSDSKKSYYTSTLILSNYIKLDYLEDIFKKIKSDYGHVACDLTYK